KVQREERLIDLYSGPVYLAHKAILEHVVGLHTVHGILSALYGWAEPDRRVKPYNMRLDTVAERQEWSGNILAQIRKWLEAESSGELFLLDGDPRMIPSARKQPKILVLAGSDYVDGWAPEARKLGVLV